MASLESRSVTKAIPCSTKTEGEDVSVPDLQVIPGHGLRGSAVLSDGASIPRGVRMLLSSETLWETQEAMLGEDGKFDFKQLAPGSYSISVAVQGYQVPQKQPWDRLVVEVGKDITDYKVTLVPNMAR